MVIAVEGGFSNCNNIKEQGIDISSYLAEFCADLALDDGIIGDYKRLYMPGRFRDRVEFWKALGASPVVLDWIEHGFMAWFKFPCRGWRKKNQPSCFEPQAHFDFISDSMKSLVARGVVGLWDSSLGPPKVISPLKVVPKKGNKLRLILDLSRLNEYLVFPKFKYDHINKVKELFSEGDWLFSWDLKDGYWHQELHPNMFTYMAFEWEGRTLYFRCMPFGLAPACWVFTKLIRVLVDYWRVRGLACLSYIDDGAAGAHSKARALFFRNMVIETLLGAGWFVNWEKSDWTLSQCLEFIGFQFSTASPGGWLQPSVARSVKLRDGLSTLMAARYVTARKVARVAGYIVSLRPVFDPMALLFTKHMYIFVTRISDERGWDYRTTLEGEARSEVKVWVDWLDRWIRKPLWSDGQPPVWVQAQDASDVGVGGWLGKLGGLTRELDRKGRSHTVGFPREFLEAVGRLDQWDRVQSSTYRELFALYFMIDTFKEVVRGSSILIQADNRALFFICSSGKTSVLVIHALLVKLFWLCVEYSIAWDIVWLPRELNQWADDLSKFIDQDDWCLSPETWSLVVETFKKFDCTFTCDRFASYVNRLLDSFCALHWCPGVWFVDCFSRSWESGFSWWHPNPKDIPRILDKVVKDRARGAVLVPLWSGAWWWLKLCPDGRHFDGLVRGWFELERSNGLFVKGPSNSFWSREIPRTRILVLWLDGRDLGVFREGRLGFCALGGCSDCSVKGCFI